MIYNIIKILENNNCDIVQFGIKLVNLEGELVGEWTRQDMTFNNSKDGQIRKLI